MSARVGWLAGVCVVAAVVPIVVAAVRALVRGWVAVGDNAYFALRAGDVLTEHHPWLGTWTSASLTVGIDINNPGPLYFDVLALPVKLGGDAGLAVGVALLNIASVLGVAVVARRVAGLRAVVVAMAAAAGLGWAMGSELLFDPWQPNGLLFPVLLFVVMVWALACGDLAVLPWAVGVGSFIVQTHLGYVLVVPALGLWGVGAAGLGLWRSRAGGGERWRRWGGRWRRVAVVSAVVGVVCWSQSLIEQFVVEGRGNLGRLVSSVGAAQETVGLGLAPRFVAERMALPPWWARPSLREEALGPVAPPALAPSLVGLVVLVGVLGAAVVVARRRGDHPGRMAAVTGLVVLAVALAAATTMPVGVVGELGVAAHHVLWLWPMALFVTVAVVLALVAGPDPGSIPRGSTAEEGTTQGSAGRAGRVRGRPVLVAVAGAAVVLGALNLPAMNAGSGPSADADAIPTVRALLPQLDVLRDEPGVLLDIRSLRLFEPYSTRVMVELDRLGVPWYVDDAAIGRQVGDGRVGTGDASVRLVLREGDRAREVPPGMHRIAFVEGLSHAEAAELTALEDRLTPFIAGGGLSLVDRTEAEVRFDEAQVPDLSPARLHDPDHLFAAGTASSRWSRALVYLVDRDRLEVPEPWVARLERYAELRLEGDRLTVAVFAEPLEGA